MNARITQPSGEARRHGVVARFSAHLTLKTPVSS